MTLSEFRWNKKRKHYAYLYKKVGNRRKNILISSKSIMVIKKSHEGKQIVKNIPLYQHPNPEKSNKYYLIPKQYIDDFTSFELRVYPWKWHKNDKRKVKRIKKSKKKPATIPSNS